MSFLPINNTTTTIMIKKLSNLDLSEKRGAYTQAREEVTIQPKEKLATLTKAKITINNYLGGKYFLTVDEMKVIGENLYLIESKHSKKALLPSNGDIKDGLLKMILFCNLSDTKIDGKKIECESILELTSVKLKGAISSKSSLKEKDNFFSKNKFSSGQKQFIHQLFEESISNGFTINIKHAE
jgi:hypothetical protein